MEEHAHEQTVSLRVGAALALTLSATVSFAADITLRYSVGGVPMKYATIVPGGMANSAHLMAINLEKWNEISPKDQKAFRAEITKAEAVSDGATRVPSLWDAATADPRQDRSRT